MNENETFQKQLEKFEQTGNAIAFCEPLKPIISKMIQTRYKTIKLILEEQEVSESAELVIMDLVDLIIKELSE